jgi:hypothetical protein
MAARLAPDKVRRTHQSLHHLVATAPWNDEVLLERVRQSVLPRMRRRAALTAWIVDDTSIRTRSPPCASESRAACSGGYPAAPSVVSLSL